MKALLIVNPVSGKRRIIGELVEIISRLEKGGYVTTVHVTERRGDATKTARIHGGEYDVIVCCGGDGTLSETANATRQKSGTFRPAQQMILHTA